MQYHVYILKSELSGKFYIGQTADIENRLVEHNSGKSKSTKAGIPWVLVYSEEHPTRSSAIQRERFLKSPDGWKELQRIKATVQV